MQFNRPAAGESDGSRINSCPTHAFPCPFDSAQALHCIARPDVYVVHLIEWAFRAFVIQYVCLFGFCLPDAERTGRMAAAASRDVDDSCQTRARSGWFRFERVVCGWRVCGWLRRKRALGVGLELCLSTIETSLAMAFLFCVCVFLCVLTV